MSIITKVQILNDIKDYCLNPKIIIDSEDIPIENLSQIPSSWLNLLSLEKINFAKLRELWHPVIDKFEIVIEDLESRLQGLVILLEDNQPPSLLYVFLNEQELYYHRGFPPIEEQEISHKIKPFWLQLPKYIKKLYTIHNGWVSMFDLSMGHKPIDNLSILSWSEWNLESEVIKNLPFNYKKTIIIFSNGGSGYIGFELPKPEEIAEPRPLIFWSNKPTQPDLNINFWTIFNSWITIDLQEKDYNQEWMEEMDE